MIAIFHGCLPVFSLGTAAHDDALPFEEREPLAAAAPALASSYARISAMSPLSQRSPWLYDLA